MLQEALGENPLSPQDFAGFFQEVLGHPPYPWQEALLGRVLERGWPEAVAVPTGMGKTAVLLVAVFHMALRPEAHRRVVYVVNRRLVVDQAWELALVLKAKLEGAQEGDTPLARAARRLAVLGGGVPLEVVRLRGGIPKPRPTLLDPARPAILLATVDMAGSRLLHRGYGVPQGLLPVEGALFGVDALYLLDEAHLEAPFLGLLKAVEAAPPPVGRFGIRVVALTATPETLGDLEAFHLTPKDYRHGGLKRLLSAPREVKLLQSPPGSRVRDLVEEALKLRAELQGSDASPAPVAVVVNRVGRALEVYRRLGEKLDGHGRVLLLTGRMRPYERDLHFANTGELQKRIDKGEVAFVVATQALEVGAHLDFLGMVMELADLPSLIQRLGRLNRRGQWNQAKAVILGEPDPEPKDALPYSQEALKATWAWLKGQGADGGVDLSPEALRQRLGGNPPQRAAFGRPSTPFPLPEALWPLLAHTHPLIPLDPAPLLHGLEGGPPEVEVVWRADLPEGEPLVLNYLRAVPPGPKEGVRLPLFAVRAWLEGLSLDFADLEGEGQAEGKAPREREKAQVPAGTAYRFDGESVEAIPLGDLQALRRLRPGDVLLLPSVLGGLADGQWDPSSRAPVPDVAEWGEERPRLLRLHPQVLAQAFRASKTAGATHAAEEEEDPAERAKALLDGLWEHLDQAQTRSEAREGVRRFLEENRSALPREWHPLVDLFWRSPFELWPWEENAKGYGGLVLFLPPESPLYGAKGPEGLQSHSEKVWEVLRGFLGRLGLVEEDELRWAALGHDLAKADPRMQEWMILSTGGGVDPALFPLAKSGTRLRRGELEALRRRSGYPRGQRHEHVAARPLVKDYPMAAHLVATHHGRGRPLPESSPDRSSWRIPVGDFRPWSYWPGPDELESVHGLEKLEAGYLENFASLLARLGPWGLAYWEALLRLADFLASGGDEG